jgi:hypothetical protein
MIIIYCFTIISAKEGRIHHVFDPTSNRLHISAALALSYYAQDLTFSTFRSSDSGTAW